MSLLLIDRVVVDELGMITNQMRKHNRSEIVAVHGSLCAATLQGQKTWQGDHRYGRGSRYGSIYCPSYKLYFPVVGLGSSLSEVMFLVYVVYKFVSPLFAS
jgi:hypothetical protein